MFYNGVNLDPKSMQDHGPLGYFYGLWALFYILFGGSRMEAQVHLTEAIFEPPSHPSEPTELLAGRTSG